jgi:hypothetical protein
VTGEQARQRAVLQHVGDLEPVADGVQALPRHIVGVVAPFASRTGPSQQGGPDALAHFLLLFVQLLLGRFLPGEAQVAHRGYHPQADGAPRRHPRVTLPFAGVSAAQVLLDGGVRQVACGENVWNLNVVELR